MPDNARQDRGHQSSQREVIGIVGGLGPYAHIDLERCLLTAAVELAGARIEQDLPEWIVSSLPTTPDRSAAIDGDGTDPTPWLLSSLRRLETHRDDAGEAVRGADFAVIPCHTAHAFLPSLRAACRLPILDLVEATVADVLREHLGAVVGILATTGTLSSGIYQAAFDRRGIRTVSLLDDADGRALHDSLVMRAVYGEVGDGESGFKIAGESEAVRDRLLEAARALVERSGAAVIVPACTEITIAIRGGRIENVPIADPTRILARAAICRAYAL